ncbi:glycosyltransferase family 2 protein [Halomonas sp. PBN3]|uniref:glycosyltransferase family 2 protein n=1 Tax=Halomonas sp. PBN3 TaxID=1397528 RepID=UPI0009DD3C1A|nr:glycosyltransferase [Halomonas sp. PBN3]
MLLSIVVTAYESKETINKCLDSILSCKDDRFEVLVIDDCSSEPIKDEVCSYKDSRVRYFYNEKNIGPGPSRNVGLYNATGDFVTFVDDDDSYLEGAVSTIISEIDRFNFDILVFDYQVKYEDVTEEKAWCPSEEGILRDFLSDKLVSTVWNKVYKLSVLSENNIIFPSCHSEDSLFNFRFLLASRNYRNIRKSLYLFDKSGDSITKSVYSSRSFVQVSGVIDEMYCLAGGCSAQPSDIREYLDLRKFLFLFKDPVLRLYRDWKDKRLDPEVLNFFEKKIKKMSFNEGLLLKSGMLSFRDWMSVKVFRLSPRAVFLIMRAMAVR